MQFLKNISMSLAFYRHHKTLMQVTNLVSTEFL